MKNIILIPLLFIITSYFTYSFLFMDTTKSHDTPKNISVLSKDTTKSIIPTESTSRTKENLSETKVTATKYTNTNKSYNNNNNNGNKIDKETITISSFLSSLKCSNHVLQKGETLTQIARKYESTCKLNTTIKLIKSINKINDENNINSGMVLYIPESFITTGTMHPITNGDTWYSIVRKYYSQYDVASITKVLIYINNLPNNDLPLGESLFLPSI